MIGDEKLAKVMSFHLRELKASSLEGDYDEIGRQHQNLFTDMLVEGNFKVPTKSCIEKCILATFPKAEAALQDRYRDHFECAEGHKSQVEVLHLWQEIASTLERTDDCLQGTHEERRWFCVSSYRK